MKLVGYIKEKKENSFRSPIYIDLKGNYFSHVVDERYNITAFTEVAIAAVSFQKVYLSKNFEINAKGALIFAGKDNYIHYNAAPEAIEEIIYYLNDHSTDSKANAFLDEAMLLKNRIFSDHFVVENFVVKMNPKEEHIILSFDFPAPQKETLAQRNSTIVSNDESSKKSESGRAVDKNNDEAFTKAIKYLNSVDMNFELKLKLRAEERRSKLKMFNYQFKLNQNTSKREKSEE